MAPGGAGVARGGAGEGGRAKDCKRQDTQAKGACQKRGA